MRMTRLLVIVAAVSMLLPLPVAAQNTTAATAVYTMVGGPYHEFWLNDVAATNQRWYHATVRNGRSYCVEVVEGQTETDAADPYLTVYRDNTGTTVLLSNGNVQSEPDAAMLSRVCFQASLLSSYSALAPEITWQITDGSTGTFYYRTRIVETSLWASWFFVGGDYNSFLLLRNTTDSTVHYTARWRSPSGTEIGSTTGSVAANSALGINARTYIADPVTNFNGTVEVTHDGSPEALVGQVTSMSASTGLGYDSTMFQRRPW
jgi:hypothetical protein